MAQRRHTIGATSLVKVMMRTAPRDDTSGRENTEKNKSHRDTETQSFVFSVFHLPASPTHLPYLPHLPCPSRDRALAYRRCPRRRDRFAPAAAGIFAVAFFVRLVHVWQIRPAPFFSVLMGDSRGYDEWARRIAGGDWIGHDVFYQAPLYPYFLGVIYADRRPRSAARSRRPDRDRIRVVRAARGWRRGGCSRQRAGIAAGLILALYAPAIFFDGLLQKSVLDVFFVCLALWLIAQITTVTAENAQRKIALCDLCDLRG